MTLNFNCPLTCPISNVNRNLGTALKLRPTQYPLRALYDNDEMK